MSNTVRTLPQEVTIETFLSQVGIDLSRFSIVKDKRIPREIQGAELEQYTTDSRNEWLKDRINYFGGSDAAALKGLSPYCSYEQLIQKKVEQRLTGVVAQLKGAHLQKGFDSEPIIADKLAKMFDDAIVWDIPMFLVHKNNLASATPDGFATVGDQLFVLEYKWVGKTKKKDWFDKDGNPRVPKYYETQLIHYLGVLGTPNALIACIFSDAEDAQPTIVPYTLQVGAFEESVELMKKANEEINERVKAASQGADEVDTLDTMLAELQKRDIDIANMQEERAMLVEEIVEKMTKLQVTKREYDNFEFVRTKSRGKFDDVSFKTTHPELYEKCLKTTTKTAFNKKLADEVVSTDLINEFTIKGDYDGGLKIKEKKEK